LLSSPSALSTPCFAFQRGTNWVEHHGYLNNITVPLLSHSERYPSRNYNRDHADAAAEIRLSIYRELLLPTPRIYFGRGESLDAFAAGSEEDWEDEDDEMDDDDLDLDDHSMLDSFDSDSDVDMRGGGKEYIRAEEAASLNEDEEKYRMHPAILRTNKQIYSEASSLLYTEGIIMLEAGDVISLARSQLQFGPKFGVPYHGAWRSNPLLGQKELNGVLTYDNALMDGKMDPHVFARFQKVYFDANFDFEHTQAVELWIDDDTHVVRLEDAERYKLLVRTSTIMKDFVELISQSPLIMGLEVSLEVEIMVNSTLMSQEMSSADDGDDETEEKLDKLMELADERATELFLDSGICECLKELSNVKNFHFGFGFDHRVDEDVYKPLPEHVALIKELKQAVEGNFKETMV
jgi:hypothetical protein